MNSLQKAKDFLAKKASKLALAAVPLAALAVAPPAHAGGILETNFGCGVNVNTTLGGSGTCSLQLGGSTGGNSNLNWMQLFGSATNGSGGLFADFSTSGGAAMGTLPTGLYPVSWNFMLTSTPPALGVSWNVFFDLVVGGTTYSFSQSGGATTNQTVTGSGFINVTNAGNLTGFNIQLNTSSNGANYIVTIPGGGTLDLNPLSGVPEPSTGAFMLTSIGGLALMVRRKKRQS